MSHIPKSAVWYLGELVERITVEGDPRLVVHRNMRLIRADSPEAAYTKALTLGREAETTYLNPAGQQVAIEFLGLAELSVISEPLEDGAELSYTRHVVASRAETEQFVRERDHLAIFAPMSLAETPDYAAKNLAEIVGKLPA